MNVFEKGDQSFGKKLLAHVEDEKYEWVMKICKENLYGTTEGAVVNYDLTQKLVFATDTFRDQVINHLTAQLTKGNNKISESLVNELQKQQDINDAGACYGYMNTLFHYLEETPEQQLARLVGPGATPTGDVKDGANPTDTMHNLMSLVLAMAVNMSRK